MTTYPLTANVEPQVYPFVDSATSTISYVVNDPTTNSCAIIDPVLDFDYASGHISYDSANQIIECIRNNRLKLEWLVETHVHADHLTAAPYIKTELGGKIGIGKKISEVQNTFSKIFSEPAEFKCDGSQFDHLFTDGEHYQIGQLSALAIETPGHTPACMTHVLGDAAFVGDTLFMPDGGTARADFPGGDAGQLYDSIEKILSLPPTTRLFMCHDYGPGGRDVQWQTTVSDQVAQNIHIGDGVTRDEFIEMRQTRDASLGVPKLIIPSLQVNMRAGTIPLDKFGNPFIKIPLNAL